MNKMIGLATTAFLLLPMSTLYAAETQDPEKQGQDKAMQMSAPQNQPGMRGMMQKNMHKMMEQMGQIHSTQDREKRRQLMHEHMQSMHEGLQMMRSMGGGMMMGMTGGKGAVAR